MLSHSQEKPLDYILQVIEESPHPSLQPNPQAVSLVQHAATQGLPDTHLGAALGQNIHSPNRVLVTEGTYASLAVGLPELVSVDLCEETNYIHFLIMATNLLQKSIRCEKVIFVYSNACLKGIQQ